MRGTHYVIILAAITLFLFFFGLGDMALTDPDESFYAETAREMLNRGEWITPHIFGKPQFEKPVLFYILVVLSYMVFGVGEFAARFPAAVFGMFGVLGVYFLGKRLFSPLCGFLSGLILGTSIQYLALARACVTDMALTVLILYTFVFFLAGWSGGRKANYLAASLMAALAVLTKGPIGLFIPGLIVLLYIISSREWDKLKKIPAAWCILLFLAVSLPWYITVWRVHGAAFVDEFFGFHNVTRFLEPEHRIGTSPFFYIPVILGGFFPWSVFLFLGAWGMWREKAVSGQRSEGIGHRAFLLIWFLVVFLFFSASSTKLVTYIFPLFPVLAVVTGRYWERFISPENGRQGVDRTMNAGFMVFGALSVLAAAGTVLLVRHEYPGTPALKGAVMGVSAFLAGIIVSAFFLFRGRKMAAFSAIIAAVMISSLPVVRYIFPVIDVHESSKVLSQRVKELASDSEAVGGENDHRRGIAFYMQREDIADIHPNQALREFFSREDRVWGIIQLKHYDNLKRDMPGSVSGPLFRAGKYVVITNEQ
jgi:4-amino-4-deoxy-L-arabinose transferase-like glycosyltransferase